MGEPFFTEALSSADLWFPEQASDMQQLFYESMAGFARDVVGPAENALEGGDYALARSLFEQCAELGIFAAELEEKDGGLGFGVLDATLMGEAMGRANSLAVGLMVHQGVGMLPVATFGNEAQRAHYLPLAAEGRCIMAFALTEPHCGSDALALTTSAIPEGDGFRINGTKQFITNAAYAGCFITFARIPVVGITAFLVDAGTPGLSIGPEEKKLGQHASSTCSVHYEDVFVEHTALLGIPGEGHKIALNMLNLGRLKLAAASVGKMKVLLPEAVAYVTERNAFGQPITAFGMLRDRLARMASLLYAVESTVYRVASQMDHALEGVTSAPEKLKLLQDFALECALVKSFATESLGTFTDDMLQLYGGYGFSEEYPAAKAYRDARVTRLYEGTTEICRLTAMQRLLAHCMETRTSEVKPTGIAGQKFLFGQLLQQHVKDSGGDLKAMLARQTLTGTFGMAFENIYAAESVLLRGPSATEAARDLAQYFIASATSRNIACLHHILGTLGTEREPFTTMPWEQFPCCDTVTLRDAIVQRLCDNGGCPGGGPLC